MLVLVLLGIRLSAEAEVQKLQIGIWQTSSLLMFYRLDSLNLRKIIGNNHATGFHENINSKIARECNERNRSD
jgi:hypothetical protein